MRLLRHNSPPSTCVSRAPNWKTLAETTGEAGNLLTMKKAVFLLNGSL